MHSLSNKAYHIETYAVFKALTEVYFLNLLKIFFSEFVILLIKEITWFKPEVTKLDGNFRLQNDSC